MMYFVSALIIFSTLFLQENPFAEIVKHPDLSIGLVHHNNREKVLDLRDAVMLSVLYLKKSQ